MSTASCNGELVDAQFLQRYMGTYVMHSLTSSSTTSRGAELAAEISVPAIHCSFPSSLHAQYEAVKEQCDGWILDVAQPPTAAARQLLQECVLPRLTCRNIPNACSVTRLVHVTKMVAWLTIADDDDDHPEALGADEVNTTHHASQVLSILRGIPATPTASAPAHEGEHAHVPFDISKKKKTRDAALRALAELWAEMRREMSPSLCARFVSTMEDYYDAVRVQATYRKANRLPAVQAYKEIRRHASFILPCFVLLEYALGIELDDATYANERIQDFRNAATDYICLCNDLISCKMEIGVGDYFNMASIVHACNAGSGDGAGLTLQEAVDRVADMAHEMDARCVSMLQTMFQDDMLSTSCSTSAHIIRTYVSGLCNCMSGSLAWYLESPRYATS